MSQTGPGKDPHLVMSQMTLTADQKLRCNFCQRTIGASRNDRAMQHFGVAGEGMKIQVKVCTGPANAETVPEWIEFKSSLQNIFLAKKIKKDRENAMQTAMWAGTPMDLILRKGDSTLVTPPKRHADGTIVDPDAWQKEATKLLVRGIYSSGMAPNVLNNEHFLHALRFISGNEFQAPSSYQVLNSGLTREYEDCKQKIDSVMLPLAKYGWTMVGDGATNVNKDPILNILLVQGNASFFVECRQVSGIRKSKEFVASMFIEWIKAMPDPESVVCVCTDNGVRSSWPIIEAACPWVVCCPCQPHVLNLLLKDIGSLPGLQVLFSKLQKLRVFIRNHQIVKALYDKFTTDDAESDAFSKLSQIAGTRFASEIMGLRNVLKNRDPIRRMLRSEELEQWMEDGNKTTKDADGVSNSTLVADLKKDFLDAEEVIWSRMTAVNSLLHPIEDLLRFAEQDNPTLSKIHMAWCLLLEHLEGLKDKATVTDSDRIILQDIIDKVYARFTYGYSTLAAVAYMLDPEFLGCQVGEEEMACFQRYLEKYFHNVTDPTTKYKKIASVLDDLVVFRNSGSSFASLAAKEAIGITVGSIWWENYALGLPGGNENDLRKIAMRVLSCVSGASASERSHKAVNFVHSKTRNRLLPSKMEMALYLKQNLQNVYANIGGTLRANGCFAITDEDDDDDDLEPWQIDTLKDLAWISHLDAEDDTAALKTGVGALEQARKKTTASRANTQLGWVTPTAKAIGLSRSGRALLPSTRVRSEHQVFGDVPGRSRSEVPGFPAISSSSSGPLTSGSSSSSSSSSSSNSIGIGIRSEL